MDRKQSCPGPRRRVPRGVPSWVRGLLTEAFHCFLLASLCGPQGGPWLWGGQGRAGSDRLLICVAIAAGLPGKQGGRSSVPTSHRFEFCRDAVWMWFGCSLGQGEC